MTDKGAAAPYTRFVLISHLRSGTHLLRTLLESHPAIVCQSEVFNSDDPQLPFPLTTPSREILERWVYRDFNPSIRCVGFALQAYHPWGLQVFPGIRANPRWADVWDLLGSMPDLRVIHLRRDNLLRRHLSHVLARETGVWHDWVPERAGRITHLHAPAAHGGDIPRPVVTLDAERLRTDFEEVERLHAAVARRFAGDRYLALSYEQLSADRKRQCARLLAFLGLPPARLKAAVSRLDHRPLSASIRNYDDLQATFAGTRWSRFFEP